MSNKYQKRLEKCFVIAGERFEQSLGFAMQSQTVLRIEQSAGFAVKIVDSGDFFSLIISEKVVDEIDRIWDLLWETPVLTTGKGFDHVRLDSRQIDGFEELAELSLIWLILHELMHVEMNHLSFSPEAQLIEVGSPDRRSVPEIPVGLDAVDLPLIDKCFEMQADSEATDVFLGSYNKDRWGDLRVKAVCIFVVMALVERENVQVGNVGMTHPKAGTRFFTLMGHLFQMWLYPNAVLDTSSGDTVVKTPEIPTEAEFKSYAHHVLTPLVGDAAYVAGFCDAHSFLKDIEGKGALFRDIFTAQYGEELTKDSFETAAGKEWLELRGINERMMIASGHRD